MRINWYKVAKIALPAVASAGVIATAVLSGKAVSKAHRMLAEIEDGVCVSVPMTRKEKFTATWKCYVPAALVAMGTIGAIVGQTVIFGKREASLLAACALAVADKRRWIEATEEEFGAEGKQKVQERVALADRPIVKADIDQKITSMGLFTIDTLDWDVHDEKLRTFYDQYSDMMFESTIAKVLEAEYHLNRNFVLGGDISCKEFYDFLGVDISTRPDLEENHWDGMTGEYCWIDFNHTKVTDEDGHEIFIIEMDWEPDTSWREAEFGDSYRQMPPSVVLSPKEIDQGPSAQTNR